MVVGNQSHRLGSVGEQVRAVRKQRNCTLRQLADLIGVSAATISAIENERVGVTVARLKVIAEALDTTAVSLLRPPGDLITDVGENPKFTQEPFSQDDWRRFAPLDVDVVLAAAIPSFVETGYHGSTMRSIARRAEMSVPGVYHYYASKQALLVRILDLTMDDLDWRVRAARESGDGPIARLSGLVEALALFHTLRAELAFIGASEMRSLENPDRARITQRRNAIQRFLDEEIAAACRGGQAMTAMPSEVGRAIATMCTSLPQWFDNHGPTTPREIALEYARLAVRMVGGYG
ncbi:TetR family transcriptional regulator [Mycolicibacterium sp. ELW1]|uniref:TetR family transcriptional regulator n=1 Tax=Mycobacteriaceae TaxID=1762 RepID=UPI0011EC2730|nr:TetR family transcriptional regulator [Mycobacterium sp. ELW1]QEN12970.1 TetR family transcriptional regulator [Mycobacterium sp. ELW1]